MYNRIFQKFILKCDTGKEINLNSYITKYRDHEKNFCHTLKNIILFENININGDNANLFISYYDKNHEVCDMDLLYNNIKDKHINYFIKNIK